MGESYVIEYTVHKRAALNAARYEFHSRECRILKVDVNHTEILNGIPIKNAANIIMVVKIMRGRNIASQPNIGNVDVL
jgi:hypothetical protein